MIFQTESGSTYEIELQDKKVRRLNGTGDATPRMGTDGEWKSYVDISDLIIGSRILFVWQWDQDEEGQLVARSTVTSKIKSIWPALSGVVATEAS